MSSLDLQYVAELVAQAQEGDSNAFAELFAATYQKQYALAHSLLADSFFAQQALQNAYVQALRGLSSLRDPSLIVVWLSQLTLRACFSLQNAYGLTQQAAESRMIELGGEYFSVRQILTLPLSEAQTLLLSRLCGMRPRAIASLLEIRRSDVRRHMRRGLRRIRALSGVREGKTA